MKEKGKILSKIKDENAEVMLESVIIIQIVLFVLIAMISLGFMFYQQCVVNTISAKVAEDIGSGYKLIAKDGNKDSSKINLYRTSLALNSAKQYHSEQGKKKAIELIKLYSFGIMESEPKVDVDMVVDNVGRLHAEVTVSLESSVLFDSALKYFGFIDSTPVFSSTARAECLDITSYAGQVHFMDYITEKGKDSNILNIVKQIVGIIKDGADIREVFTKKR